MLFSQTANLRGRLHRLAARRPAAELVPVPAGDLTTVLNVCVDEARRADTAEARLKTLTRRLLSLTPARLLLKKAACRRRRTG